MNTTLQEVLNAINGYMEREFGHGHGLQGDENIAELGVAYTTLDGSSDAAEPATYSVEVFVDLSRADDCTFTYCVQGDNGESRIETEHFGNYEDMAREFAHADFMDIIRHAYDIIDDIEDMAAAINGAAAFEGAM